MSLALRYDSDTMACDLRRDGGNLLTHDGMEAAVLISLFSDRLAESDDEPSDGTTDRRGWWADQLHDDPADLVGSRLWLLARSKASQANLVLAQEYATEALQWMIDDGLAETIDVTTERQGERLAVRVRITRPDKLAPKFEGVWAVPVEL